MEAVLDHMDAHLRRELEERIRSKYEVAAQSRLSSGDFEKFVQDEVQFLIPFIREARAQNGGAGPLIDSEFFVASMRRSKAEIEQVQSLMQRNLEMMPNDAGARILATLLRHSELDLAALDSLSADPTEERLAEVTRQIVQRMEAWQVQMSG